MTGVSEVGVGPALANIRWEFCSAKEFDRFSAVWDELNQATYGSPALTAVFVTALLKEFGTGRELLAIGYRGETAQAITVLRRKNIGFWETFQPAQAPLGAWIHRPPYTFASLVPGLLGALPGFAVALGITQQDPELVRRPDKSETGETLDYIETARVTISGSFDEYWAKRGKNLRNNTKKQLNRLAKDGVAPHLDTITDLADMAQAIADYGRLESAGWKAALGTAIHPDNAQGRFYRAVLEAFCRRGAGRIYRYRYGDLIVAMDLCIESRDSLIVLKTTYDESIRDSSPASLMRHEYFRHIFDEARIKRVEFYGKVMDWHTKWSDEIRMLYHANFYRFAAVLKARRSLRPRSPEATASVALPSPATVPMAATAVPASPAAAPASQEAAYKWQIFPASEFGRHMQAWDSVLMQRSNPLNEAAFVNVLLSTFLHGDEVLAICGDPRAPYAMAILTHSRFGVWNTFQQSQGPLGAWVHRRDVSFEDIVPSLFDVLPGMPFMVSITHKDPSIHARPQESARLKVLDYVRTSRILVNRSFEDYWQARDKKIRYEIGRRLKRLSELGIKPRLEVIRDPGDVDAAIKMYGNLEASGWKGKAGTAMRSDNEQGVFYRAILKDYCARGKGRIYRYCFDDQVVAMQLCLENANALVLLKTAYDENYRRYSPGILMKHALFEHVFREGTLKKIEFYETLLTWQAKWIDELRLIYHVNYYRWPCMGRIPRILDKLRRLLGPVARTPGRAQFDNDSVNETLRDAVQGRTYACTVYDNLLALPDRYRPLFSRAGGTSVYFTLPWYLNFVQTILAPNERLRIYAVDTATTPPAARAVLPMYYRHSDTGWFRVRALNGLSNYYTSLFGPVIDSGEPEAQKLLDTLAAAIAGDEIRWDVIDLHPLASDTHVFPNLISAFRSAGLLVQTYFCFGNWYLQVRGRSYAKYYATLPSQLRNTIKRKKEHLAKSVKSRIVIYRDEADLQEGLRAYEQIYAASWKTPEPYPGFIRGLCRTCAESGWLRLGVIYVDDQPAAAQIWIVCGRIASIYKLAYDERFAKLSLGTILTAHLMEHVIDIDKVQEVDYLSGDDAYKKDWMSDRRERWGIVAFNLRTPRGALAALRHLGASAAKRAVDAVRHRGGTGT